MVCCKNVSMGFAVPMGWREQIDHITDCYFCFTKAEGYKGNWSVGMLADYCWSIQRDSSELWSISDEDAKRKK
ncbi:unnamed protein product [Clavelina lepadiformis]|uniref:Uncharacterized protein n=1 Tax=Clavelina lepadiformis TaxID=159417 RepID=A0ABP0EYM8_CLALP